MRLAVGEETQLQLSLRTTDTPASLLLAELAVTTQVSLGSADHCGGRGRGIESSKRMDCALCAYCCVSDGLL